MNRSLPHRVSVPAVLSLMAAVAWGCTAVESATFSSTNSAGGAGGGSVATGGAGGTTTGASTSSTSGIGGGFNIDAGTGGTEIIDDGGACTGSSVKASLTPLDMIVLLDRSGSMWGTSWDGVTNALNAFFVDPKSTGISVGLVFFPSDNPNDDCVWTDYANLDVPVGVLPGNAQPLADAIEDGADGGTGMTPTWGGLKGALYAATSYQDKNPTHKVVVVIATDGDPTSCAEEDAQAIADLAKSARNYNGVLTYAIGVTGATMSNLDKIAVSGGTTAAYDVTGNVTKFAQAMADIRANALACELPIPPPPAGQQLDTKKVNVNYTPGGATDPVTLPNVLSEQQCGTKMAWYYDNNQNPKKIKLCPSVCDALQGDSSAAMSVVFGCVIIQG